MSSPKPLVKFRALVVDPNPLTRSYIWEAVLSDAHFSVVTASKSTEDSITQFSQGYACDVVLVSSNIDLLLIRGLMKVMKESEGGKEAALVAIVYANEQNSSALGTLLAEGADGLLLSPFSVHSLAQVAQIASRVKGEFDRKRKLAAAKIMAGELLIKFDEINRALLKGVNSQKSIEKMQKVGSGLERLLEGSPELFAEAMIDVIRNIEPPKGAYQGPSQRVKRKLAAAAAN
jgi:CheY-like chemotaxis protein